MGKESSSVSLSKSGKKEDELEDEMLFELRGSPSIKY